MNKIKITVIRKVNHTDLSARYENPIEHACDMQEEQTFISTDAKKPEDLCESAELHNYRKLRRSNIQLLLFYLVNIR